MKRQKKLKSQKTQKKSRLGTRRKVGTRDRSFEEHSKELVGRIIVCVVVWLALFIAAICNLRYVFGWVLDLAEAHGYQFIAVAPQDIFIEQIRVSAVCGIVVGLPVYCWHVIRFIAPAFSKGRATMYVGYIFGVVLFYVGMLFSVVVVLPVALSYFRGLGSEFGIIGQVSISSYTSLVCSLSLALGVVFELPIIVVILSILGLLTPERMKGCGRFVIIASFIVGAIITPPDILSQAIVATPIIALYYMSIVLCAIITKTRRKNNG